MNARVYRRRQSRSLRHAVVVLTVLLVGGAAAFLFLIFSNTAAEDSSDRQLSMQELAVQEAAGVAPSGSISIDLVGDVNFTDGWALDVADANGGQVSAAFAPELLEHLISADIFYANHEFTMSDRGVALNKTYTFRASPARIAYWEQLGVDVVGLANNHAYDYGEEAFLDTLAALESSGIAPIGAGRTLAEALQPVYFSIDGYTVAFVAADRSQKGDEVRAAEAGEQTPGVLFCFDDTLFLETVTRAAAGADFVIAIPHWGTENSTVLENEQVSLAHALIDAGADAVIGSHPHILQGMEWYEGKLIAYSLGNFWLNWLTVQTLVLNIEIVEGEPVYRILPALQTEQQLVTSEQISQDIIELMRGLSPTATITDDGTVTAA